MNTAAISAELLKRPDLPLVLKQVQHSLDNEAKRHHEFREWLEEDAKAEFINGEVKYKEQPHLSDPIFLFLAASKLYNSSQVYENHRNQNNPKRHYRI
ncbi:MAG: hypothetical protein SGI94_21180 [Saprospiraceae bacterium]|nr:hypothetical protein [Saprospiraceae bacterium]